MKPSFQFKRFLVHLKQHRFAVAPLLSIFVVFVLFQNCGRQVSNSGGYTNGSPSPLPAQQVLSISPTSATLRAGQTLAFTASGGSQGGYNFSLTSGSGSITSGGVYTAPLSVSLRGAAATIQAMDSSGAVITAQISIPANGVVLQDPTLQDVAISDPIALSISPASVSLVAGQSFAFSASGGAHGSYTFSLTSGSGSVTPGGVYTAPAIVGPRGSTAVIQVTDSRGAISSAHITVSQIISDLPPTGVVQELQPTR